MHFNCDSDGHLNVFSKNQNTEEARIGPVFAPLSGRITFLKSSKDSFVSKHTLLARIEYYKSETQILSPVDAFSKQLVEEGTWVNIGDAVLEMHY